jgi:hypothetical protein
MSVSEQQPRNVTSLASCAELAVGFADHQLVFGLRAISALHVHAQPSSSPPVSLTDVTSLALMMSLVMCAHEACRLQLEPPGCTFHTVAAHRDSLMFQILSHCQLSARLPVTLLPSNQPAGN